MSRIDRRLFGKVDYKRARYLFHAEYAIQQALFVDSKAEKSSGSGTATLQISQLSMLVRQMRSGQQVEYQGRLPTVLTLEGETYITTTVFVKYNYSARDHNSRLRALESITVVALPNGMLQNIYNPSASDTIWLAGRNAPTRGEEFRVRLSFAKLKRKSPWRVQTVLMPPAIPVWNE